MTINSQLSLHSRSNIVLVLFLDRLKAFQPHVSQLLGFRNGKPSISILNKRLRNTVRIEYQNVRFRLCLKEQIIPFVFPVFSC